MTGSYLGTKKIVNVAAGAIYQANALWHKSATGDTTYHAMMHWAVESFVDMPLTNKGAINAYVGYFNTNYGTHYLRYNGVMNPANGSTLTATNSIVGQGPTYGNSYPMFGTGHVVYSQVGYLFPSKRWMPYATATWAQYDRLQGLSTHTYNLGLNYYLQGNKSKLSLDFQNRPSYQVQGDVIKAEDRLNTLTLQFQIFI